jgi:hypothetical protein
MDRYNPSHHLINKRDEMVSAVVVYQSENPCYHCLLPFHFLMPN